MICTPEIPIYLPLDISVKILYYPGKMNHGETGFCRKGNFGGWSRAK